MEVNTETPAMKAKLNCLNFNVSLSMPVNYVHEG